MKEFGTIYTDVSYYKNMMCYPIDLKFLWEWIDKSYEIICELNRRLDSQRSSTNCLDARKANLAYRVIQTYEGSDRE